MGIWDKALPYFTEDELACSHCQVIQIDLRFAAMLPALREVWDNPLTPTSVCRCPAHNESVGGHWRSLHLTENPHWPTTGSCAADILWKDWPEEKQLRFARLAYQMGFAVGLHRIFCHIDGRAKLGVTGLDRTVFLYGTWEGFKPSAVIGGIG